MKPLLLYLLGTLFCSGLFVTVYRLLLVGHLAFAACRRYLLAACMLSLLLPALRIPLYPAPPRNDMVRVAAGGLPVRDYFAPTAETAAVDSKADYEPDTDYMYLLQWFAIALYAVVVILLCVVFIRRWMAIRRLRRLSTLTCFPDFTLAENASVRSPFSFLRTVFLAPDYRGEDREQIVCHEVSHVRHRHTAERIAAEVVRCLCWYNPFVWIICSDLHEVQEWEADRDVLDRGYDLTRYRMLIFHQLFGYRPDIICGLNHSFTKKRFLMMTHAEEGKRALVRLFALVPVVAVMMLLCSFTTRSSECRPAARDAASEEPAAEIRIAGGRIFFDDAEMTLDELPERIRRARADGIRSVILFVDPDTRMNLVTDVKQALRQGDVLQVRYETDGLPGLSRVLPPAYDAGAASVVQVVPDNTAVKMYPNGDVAIKERNLFTVFVESNGEILAGKSGKRENTALAALKEAIVRFVRNAGDDDALPEKEMREIALPDGGIWSYPVSAGIVSLRTSGQLNYKTYLEVIEAMTDAFVQLRDDAARARFGRGYDALAAAEREAVNKAVPIHISEAEPQR